MSVTKVGRTTAIPDPNTRDEIDRIYSLLQNLKLNSANIDLDDLARQLGRRLRDGQLAPLDRVLSAKTDGTNLSLVDPGSAIPVLRVVQAGLELGQPTGVRFTSGLESFTATDAFVLIDTRFASDPRTGVLILSNGDYALDARNNQPDSNTGSVRFTGDTSVFVPILECNQGGRGHCLLLDGRFTAKLNQNFWSRSNSDANIAANHFEENGTGRVALFQRLNASTNHVIEILQPSGSGRYISTDAGSPAAFLSSSGIWTDGCGIAGKIDRRPLRGRRLLRQVGKLRIWKWRSRRTPTEEHIGPCREDLQRHLGLAEVSGYDLGGIALRSVQALYHEVQSLKREVRSLRRATRSHP